MYADREEAYRDNARGAPSSGDHAATDSLARERQLQEQLRRRALDSARQPARVPSEDRRDDRDRSMRRRGDYADDASQQWGRRGADSGGYAPRRDEYAPRESQRHDSDDRRSYGRSYDDDRRRGYDDTRRGYSRAHDDDRHYSRYGDDQRRDSDRRYGRGDSYQGGNARGEEDYERRSVFCSQLAASVQQRDLGEFIEENLGKDTVLSVYILTHPDTGRSEGYVARHIRTDTQRRIRRAQPCGSRAQGCGAEWAQSSRAAYPRAAERCRPSLLSPGSRLTAAYELESRAECAHGADHGTG